MKNFLSKSVFVALAAFSILFVSCKSDDDNDVSEAIDLPSTLTFNDATYDLNTAIVENYGEWPSEGIYDYGLELYTNAYVMNDDGTYSFPEEDIIYSYVWIELLSPDADKIAVGTYTVSESQEPFTIYNPFATINYNTANWEREADFDIISGTLEVMANDTFEFNFSFIGEDGEVLNAYYKGDVIDEELLARPAKETKKRRALK